MKLLTAVVPCYNSAGYMSKCIDSLLPAGEAIEIVIVDDGSHDQTFEIARQYEARYPTIVKAVHQENKGHGGAVNTGIAHATGKYLKVVDSDDWVDVASLKSVVQTLGELESRGQKIDLLLTNYVYEQEGRTKKCVVNYSQFIPTQRVIGWEEIQPFPFGKYVMMHSVVYATALLHECQLTLPEHTFYVDNLFVYLPLVQVKSIYYLDVDFYRYFIGREGQSVEEATMIRRIDQQLKVNYLLIDAVDFSTPMPSAMQHYLLKHLEIVTGISSALLNRIGTEAALQKRQALWQYLHDKNPTAFKVLRHAPLGRLTNVSHPFTLWLSNQVYQGMRKAGGY